MNGWVYRHGLPRILISDGGRNVNGDLIRHLCMDLGIGKRNSSPYRPEDNGMAEKMIGTVKQIMRCLLEERQLPKSGWPSLLPEVQFTCNDLGNQSTRLSPHQLVFGRILRFPLEALLRNNTNANVDTTQREYFAQLSETRVKLQEIALQNSDASANAARKATDRGRHENIIQAGDQVMLRNEVRRDSLEPIYTGAYLVKERRGANVKVEHPMTNATKWVHLNRCMSHVSGPLTPTTCLGAAQGVASDCGSENEAETIEPDESKHEDAPEEGPPDMRRSNRERRRREFFVDPIPWD